MLRPESRALPVVLTALVALGPISTDLYLPSLPAMSRSFGAGIDQVQLTLSLFLVGFACAQLLYGPLSDRFGRRPVLLAGLTIYAAASLACALATSMPVLIAARVVQAIGACAGPVICRAVVRDLHSGAAAARLLAYMGAAMALAPCIGPMIGGMLEMAFGWRANFLALLIYGTTGLLAAALLLPETNRHRSTAGQPWMALIGSYGALLRHRSYVGFVLCSTLAYAGIFAFISGSSYVLVDVLGLTPAAYGMCFGGVVLGYMAGTFAAGRLAMRVGIDRMLRIGVGFAAVGGTIEAALAWSFPEARGPLAIAAVLGPLAVYLMGMGMIFPNATAGAIGPFPRLAGAASALMGFVQMGAAALVGIAVGHLYDGTARPMTSVIGLAGLLLVVVLATMKPTARLEPAPQR